jgi:hypothetical protein
MQTPPPVPPVPPDPGPFIFTPGPAEQGTTIDPSLVGLPGFVVLIPIAFIVFVLAPIAIAAARLMWRRANVTPIRPSWDSEQRLARLEQAIDSVAVEVERISESQRFMTRLLTESSTGALLPGNRTSEGSSTQRDAANIRRE